MAKLQVTAELIRQALFGGCSPSPVFEILGASFDSIRGVVEFDIAGPDVPDAERVVAIMTMERKTARFDPR